MIDHITVGVADFAKSTEFYDRALAPLGIKQLFEVPADVSGGVRVTGYGEDRPRFWLAEENATSGLLHIAFEAKTRSDVDAFYSAAVAAGGTDNGAPGLRPHYHPSYYAAFVIDPNGHNIEAVCHSD